MSDDACFLHTRTVRFGECDPAGVVYYPVFFNWFHETMEAWFEEELQLSYAEAIERFGFPAVETSAQFRSPIVMGEKIDIQLRVEKLGRSSVLLGFMIFNKQRALKASGQVRCVCIQVDQEGFQFAAMEIPTFLRQEMKRFTAL